MAISVDEATRAEIQAELVPLGTLWAKFGEIQLLEGAPFGTRGVVDRLGCRILFAVRPLEGTGPV